MSESLPLPRPGSPELREVVTRHEERLVYEFLYQRRGDPPTAAEIDAHVAGVLGEAHSQTGRRRRDLYSKFRITKVGGRPPRYLLEDWAPEPGATARGSISLRVRAEVLRAGRCAMCGATPAEDEIKLVVDHVVPKNWGGSDDASNLQALCTDCNQGKKDLFASYDSRGSAVADAARHAEPHRRIGELLAAFKGEWLPSSVIEAVASRGGRQADWQKRMRELRMLGWTIEYRNVSLPTGGVRTDYRATVVPPWPGRRYRRCSTCRGEASEGREGRSTWLSTHCSARCSKPLLRLELDPRAVADQSGPFGELGVADRPAALAPLSTQRSLDLVDWPAAVATTKSIDASLHVLGFVADDLLGQLVHLALVEREAHAHLAAHVCAPICCSV